MRKRLVMSESEEVVGGIPWVMEVWGAMSWSSCGGRVRVHLRMKQIGKGKEMEWSNGWLLCLQSASGGVGGVYFELEAGRAATSGLGGRDQRSGWDVFWVLRLS